MLQSAQTFQAISWINTSCFPIAPPEEDVDSFYFHTAIVICYLAPLSLTYADKEADSSVSRGREKFPTLLSRSDGGNYGGIFIALSRVRYQSQFIWNGKLMDWRWIINQQRRFKTSNKLPIFNLSEISELVCYAIAREISRREIGIKNGMKIWPKLSPDWPKNDKTWVK